MDEKDSTTQFDEKVCTLTFITRDERAVTVKHQRNVWSLVISVGARYTLSDNLSN